MRAALLAAVAIAFVLAGPAFAQSAQFAAAFQAGVDAYRLGDYAAARTHLEQARALDASLPGPHRFLAAVDAAEGKWQDCIADARRAIAANPASTEIAATRKLHDDCRAALGLAPFAGTYGDGGAIAVTANVSGAAVSLAGLRAGSTPMAPRPIGLGEVAVSASKAGWKTATATVTILPGVVTDVALVLDEEAALPVVDPEHAQVPEQGWLIVRAPAGATVAVDGAAATPDERGRYPLAPGDHTLRVEQPGAIAVERPVRITRGQEARVTVALVSLAAAAGRRRLGAIALGTAAGLTVAGAVTGLLSMHAADQARDWAELERARPPGVPLDESAAFAPIHTRADIEARADRAHTLALASGVGYGLAAAALGVGVYLLATSPGQSSVAIAPALGDGWGVTLTGALP